MKRMLFTILTCMSLSTLGIDAREITQPTDPISPKTTPKKETTVGKHCKMGPRGYRGHRGPRGHHGKRGHQGPAGISAITEYGEEYLNIPAGEIPILTPGPGISTPVPFNTSGPASAHVIYNVDGSITVNTAGTYTIEYDVKASAELGSDPTYSPMAALVVQLYKNGLPEIMTYVPGIFVPPIGEDEPFSWAEGINQTTLNLVAGDTIQLFVCPIPADPQALFRPVYGFPVLGEPEIIPYQAATYLTIEKIS